MGRFLCCPEIADLEASGASQTCSTVKFPGMGMFDATDDVQKKRRNQRKDASVVKKMEAESRDIHPIQRIYSKDFKAMVEAKSCYATPTPHNSEDEEGEKKKTRNQRKDASVVKKMEADSDDIHPIQRIYSKDFKTIVEAKSCYATPTPHNSEDEDDEKKKQPKAGRSLKRSTDHGPDQKMERRGRWPCSERTEKRKSADKTEPYANP